VKVIGKKHVEYFQKGRKLVKIGSIVKSMVFLYILGSVIPGIMLSEYTGHLQNSRTSPEGFAKFQIPVCRSMSRVFPDFTGQ
jgi:hypothetical protein